MLSENSMSELCNLLDSKKLSAEELAKEIITKVDGNSHLGAVAAFEPEIYLEEARASDIRRQNNQCEALDGIPLILKDNIDTINLPTSGGTGALAEKIPPKEASVVSALKEVGAIIAAKAVMHELAFGITSNNAVTGPARNPYDPSKIPGGSSGGTAVAVSSRQFPAGLGTDTGGSVRIPAALCGIYGYRPTTGRYREGGVIPISKTRDTVGPMARCMKDIVLLDSIMTINSSQELPPVDFKSIRIGIPKTRFWENLEPEVQATGSDFCAKLEEFGVTIVDEDFPNIWELNDNAGFPIALYEVMRELPKYLQQAGYGISLQELVEGIGSPDVKSIIASQLGDEAMPEQVYQSAIREHRPQMQKMYADYFVQHRLDAILFPTTPLTARAIGEDETVEHNGQNEPTFPIFIRNTDLASNVGAPGISIPAGMGHNLPVGMEIDGAVGDDEKLLSIATAIESVIEPLRAPIEN